MPRVIPRSEWGARYADSYRGYTAPLPKRWGYAHHDTGPAPAANATFAEDAAAVRAIEQVGQNRFGYGISYSLLIPRSGRIFHGHRLTGVGTHTHGYNSSTLAICFVGNYENVELTEEQLDSAAWLLGHGKAQGWTTDMQLDGGHRDVKPTACPGANAYRLIPEINRRALNPQEDDMPLSKEDKKWIEKNVGWGAMLKLWAAGSDAPDEMAAGQQLNQARGYSDIGVDQNRRILRAVNVIPNVIRANSCDAKELAAELRPYLKDVVGTAVEDAIDAAMERWQGQDQAELARLIVEELGRQLTEEATS